MNSSSSSSRALKCFLINSEVSEDIVLGESWELVWVLLDAVGFGSDFGSIQLKPIMQHLAVQGYIELLQRTAFIRYCSALLILAPVGDIMHWASVYLFLGCDHYLTMHI